MKYEKKTKTKQRNVRTDSPAENQHHAPQLDKVFSLLFCQTNHDSASSFEITAAQKGLAELDYTPAQYRVAEKENEQRGWRGEPCILPSK